MAYHRQVSASRPLGIVYGHLIHRRGVLLFAIRHYQVSIAQRKRPMNIPPADFYFWFELVQLLEFRYLDELLDQQCDEAAALFLKLERQAHEKSRWKRWTGRLRTSAIGQLLVADEMEEASQRIAGLTVDAIRNISAATNAINVLGDPTLDSLNDLAAKRFRLGVLSASVEKKLGLLDNLYQKVETQRHSQKSLFLEISVVILIVIEVVIGIFRH